MSLARLGSGNSSLGHSAIGGTPPQDRPPSTARSRTPDGGLVSLADPLSIHLGNSLEAALRDRVASREAQMPGQGNTLDWRDAMALILALDLRDETPCAKPSI